MTETPDNVLCFYPPDIPPWDHQFKGFERFKAEPYCGLFFDQRCGKTRTALAIVVHRYTVMRDIDATLIIAWPNGIHRNWVSEEIPQWLPPEVPRRSVIWRSGMSGRKVFKDEFALLLKSKGLAILSVNAEAITTPACKEHIAEFLKVRRVALIIDESDWASTPDSKRTEVVLKISTWRSIKLRMLLGGTPATESPFQLYSQMNILQPNFFGFKTFQIFKHHFGEYEWEPAVELEPLKIGGTIQRYKNGHVKMVDKVRKGPGGEDITFPLIDRRTGQPKLRVKKSINYATSNQFEAILRDDNENPRYRNLDELHAKMAPHTMRVLRSDVSPAPKPIHSKHFYQMSREQFRVYNGLLEEFRAELKSGFIVEAAHVLTRWLRLQQVLSNRLPPRDEGVVCESCDGAGCQECDEVGIVVMTLPEEIVDLDEDSRLEALRFVIRDPPVKTIVWARFQHEVTMIIDLVKSMGGNPVRFDGLVPERERLENLHDVFRCGSADFLIGNAAAGGRGLPMDVADLAVFYSNYFSGRMREQVEARTEALFKKTSTHVVDIICEDTIDEKIVKVLRAKKSLSAVIMRDNLREWL